MGLSAFIAREGKHRRHRVLFVLEGTLHALHVQVALVVGHPDPLPRDVHGDALHPRERPECFGDDLSAVVAGDVGDVENDGRHHRASFLGCPASARTPALPWTSAACPTGVWPPRPMSTSASTPMARARRAIPAR